MSPTAKSRIFTTLKFALPVAIVTYLIWRIEPQQWDELSSQPKDLGLLLVALIVAIAALSLSFIRWCVLVRCQGIELSMLEAFRLGSICFLLSFVSAGSVGGDVFKAIFLARRCPGKKVAAVASVLVDRGSGLYGLLLLVTLGLLLGIQPADSNGQTPTSEAEVPSVGIEQIRWLTVGLIGIGTLLLSILILGGKTVDRLIRSGSQVPLVGNAVATIGPPLRMFHHHPIAFGFSILLSLGVQSMLVLSMYLIARGLYSSPPTLAEHFVIVPMGMLASALPFTPAGIGVLEAAMHQLYKVIPAEPTEASGTLVALVFEIVKVLMAAIGTVFYWTAGSDVRESLEPREQASSLVDDAVQDDEARV